MKLIAKSIFITISLFCLLWILISWVDVCTHNNPFADDGDPHSWNAFVMMTEVE